MHVMAATPYLTSYSQTYSEFGLRQSKMWPANTLCMTIAGANAAKVAILRFEACFPDSIVGFIPDDAKADLHFVLYSLSLMKDQFLAVSRGATQDNLGLDKLLSFPILVPDVNSQRRIGALLSAYDDLVENNKRRIILLEKLAHEIYREWFVRLRFPGHETAFFSKGVPAKWGQRRLGSVLELCYGRSLKEEERIPGEFHVYGSSGIIGSHNLALVKDSGLIVGRKGNVGSIFFADRGFFPIDTVYYVKSDLPDSFLYFLLRSMNFINNDAAVPGLNRSQAYANELTRFKTEPNYHVFITLYTCHINLSLRCGPKSFS